MNAEKAWELVHRDFGAASMGTTTLSGFICVHLRSLLSAFIGVYALNPAASS